VNSRRTSSLAAGALVTGILLLSLPSFATLSGAVSARSKVPSLTSLVVPGPAGFASDATDETLGGPTGRIGFDQADAPDCDPLGLTHAQWVGSVLRYFDKNPSDPKTYVILCVTQLRSARAATANRNKLTDTYDFEATPAGLRIPGSKMTQVGPAWHFAFTVSNYFVWVDGLSASNQLKGLAFGVNVTRREYVRLSTSLQSTLSGPSS
jgi:hypothetical protein